MVAEHYNLKNNTPIHLRDKSKILYLRNINNWVKSILIQEYSRPNSTVLDICGGKLGDLPKWIKAEVDRLYVADISLESLKHAVQRYNDKLRMIRFNATFICCDCFNSSKFQEVFPRDVKVDLASCQFSLHYSFRSEESARGLLNNVSSVLKKNGYFICTIPNSCYIVKKCKEVNSNKFGNSVFSIEFTEKEPKFTAFGCSYKFFLEDAIDSLEEYLVHMDIFELLAKDYGFKLIKSQGFHDFVNEKTKAPENIGLFRKMNCFNEYGTVPVDEWNALGIYNVVVFQKINDSINQQNNEQEQQQYQSNNRPSRKEESDIIVNL
eukprot:gene4249-5318_t